MSEVGSGSGHDANTSALFQADAIEEGVMKRVVHSQTGTSSYDDEERSGRAFERRAMSAAALIRAIATLLTAVATIAVIFLR